LSGAAGGDAAGFGPPFAAGVPFGGEPAAPPLGAGPGVTVEGSFSEAGIPKLVATFAPLGGCSEIAPTLAGLFGGVKTSEIDMGGCTFVRCGKGARRSLVSRSIEESPGASGTVRSTT
jgi:hypothetical protein